MTPSRRPRRTIRPPPLLAGYSYDANNNNNNNNKHGLICDPNSCVDCPPPEFLYCRVISSSSSKKEVANEDDDETASMTTTTDSVRSSLTSSLDESLDGTPTTTNAPSSDIHATLVQVSHWASLLCVLDCTLLPVATMVLPLLGLVAGSSEFMEWLHQLGHSMALYFVVPVGATAISVNYLQHQHGWIAGIGVMGLLAVLCANAPLEHDHDHEHYHHEDDTACHDDHEHTIHNIPALVLLQYMLPLLHAVHHGLLHRVVNLTGCCLLMTSNYLSKRQQQQSHSSPQDATTTNSSKNAFQCIDPWCAVPHFNGYRYTNKTKQQ